jgi:hypothetical protein
MPPKPISTRFLCLLKKLLSQGQKDVPLHASMLLRTGRAEAGHDHTSRLSLMGGASTRKSYSLCFFTYMHFKGSNSTNNIESK